MKRFQKDKKYIRQDYKALRQLQQFQTLDNLRLKLRVSTPSNTRKYLPRSIPRQVQQSLIKSTLSSISRAEEQENTNIGFKSIVKKVKGAKVGEREGSFYKQFLELEKESKNYMCYYDKKHNHKFIELVVKNSLEKEQSIILLILRDKFSPFAASNLASRKLLALGINPDDDFERICWPQYSLLRRLMSQKSININQGVQYLVKFFIPNGQNKIKKDEFVSLISSILRPHNNKTIGDQRVTLLDFVLKKIQKEPLLKAEDIDVKVMRELLGKQSLFSCSDFLYMLFQS